MKWIIKSVNEISKKDKELCLSFMSDSRKEYINGFLSDERKEVSIVAEFLTKKLVSEFLNTSIDKIEILRSETGKPYIKNNTAYISISYSGRYIAVAVNDTPIGIDIEVIKEKDLKLIDKIFSSDDVSIIRRSKNKLLDFYKIWTAKEAYFKFSEKSYNEIKETPYTALSPVHCCENGTVISIIK